MKSRLLSRAAALWCALALSSSAPAWCEADTSIASFMSLKKEVEALRKDEARRQFRHHYEKLIIRLQSVASAQKDGSRADDAAYVAAQLQEELYAVSRLESDKTSAVNAFFSCADLFPRSNLADDALLAAARLTTDPARARKALARIVAMGNRADVGDEARRLLASLPPAKESPKAGAKSGTEKAVVSSQVGARSPAKPPEAGSTARAAGPAAGAAMRTQPGTQQGRADVTRSAGDSLSRAPVPLVDVPGRDEKIAVTKAGEGESAVSTKSTEVRPASEKVVMPAGLPAMPEPSAQPAVISQAVPAALSSVDVLPEAPPAGTPSRKVIVIRHEKTESESVVLLRVSGDVGIIRGEVPLSDGGARRIFYDLAPAKLGQRNIQPIEVHDGVVARVRAGQYDTEVVRLVVELEGEAVPTLQVVRRPFEIRLTSPIPTPAVDVLAGALQPARPAPHPAPPPDPQEVKKRFEGGTPGGVSISQQLGLAVHRVVIDPGHGGNDTGAIGPSGVREKDVTLQIAKQVKAKLLAEVPDIEVIMTREDDATLALQDRTNTANSAAADLFISIHCNASPFRRVRGVETYTLNITHDRYAMRLAARENAEMGEGSISDLDFILADLAMKSNVDDSVRLGRAVQQGVMKNLRKQWTDVPDLGLKHALFYVLMGNRMPSILVETSFLSNKMEEQRLASSPYQESIADGVVSGVRAFIEERQAFFSTEKEALQAAQQ